MLLSWAMVDRYLNPIIRNHRWETYRKCTGCGMKSGYRPGCRGAGMGHHPYLMVWCEGWGGKCLPLDRTREMGEHTHALNGGRHSWGDDLATLRGRCLPLEQGRFRALADRVPRQFFLAGGALDRFSPVTLSARRRCWERVRDGARRRYLPSFDPPGRQIPGGIR